MEDEEKTSTWSTLSVLSDTSKYSRSEEVPEDGMPSHSSHSIKKTLNIWNGCHLKCCMVITKDLLALIQCHCHLREEAAMETGAQAWRALRSSDQRADSHTPCSLQYSCAPQASQCIVHCKNPTGKRSSTGMLPCATCILYRNTAKEPGPHNSWGKRRCHHSTGLCLTQLHTHG